MNPNQIKIEEKESPVLFGLLPGKCYTVDVTDRLTGETAGAQSYSSMDDAREAAFDFLYEKKRSNDDDD